MAPTSSKSKKTGHLTGPGQMKSCQFKALKNEASSQSSRMSRIEIDVDYLFFEENADIL